MNHSLTWAAFACAYLTVMTVATSYVNATYEHERLTAELTNLEETYAGL